MFWNEILFNWSFALAVNKWIPGDNLRFNELLLVHWNGPISSNAPFAHEPMILLSKYTFNVIELDIEKAETFQEILVNYPFLI